MPKDEFYYLIPDTILPHTADEIQASLRKLSAGDAAKLRIVRGGPPSPVPQPTFNLGAVGVVETVRVRRDKDDEAANVKRVSDWLAANAGTHQIKAVAAALSLTTADVSRAKQALIKAELAVDPGKGKIAHKRQPYETATVQS